MSMIGTRVVRKEDPALLTEGGMYVADVGVGASFAPAINVFLAAGTASFKTSFAVNPIAAATGPFTHVSPTPLNSPFATPSLT